MLPILCLTTIANFFGVSMDGPDNQPRPARAETAVQQRLALASASVGPERAPAASVEIEELSKRVMSLPGASAEAVS